jgi:hypothetical protein
VGNWVESALSAETIACETAERALSETSRLRDLQTKVAPAGRAKNLAIKVLRHERNKIGQMRIEFEILQKDLQKARDELQKMFLLLKEARDMLVDERRSRRMVEIAQKHA